MPDTTEQTNALISWLSSNGLILAIAAVLLLIVYRVTRPMIHRVLVSMFRAQANALGADPQLAGQTDKRVATIEDVLARLLKFGVVIGFILVVFGVFNLWPLLAGLGLVIAAITLAGQSIVLDYLMGLLILMEGQYFQGDVVLIGTIQGTVTEVGFRRTVLIDTRGVVHSISNSLIRQSANLTRAGAIATVLIDGIADVDLERAIPVLNEAGERMAKDPAMEGRLLEPAAFSGVMQLTSLGATLRFSGRVQPEYRQLVEAEMRRQVVISMAAAGIEQVRPPVPTV